jgi:hypothetical protein
MCSVHGLWLFLIEARGVYTCTMKKSWNLQPKINICSQYDVNISYRTFSADTRQSEHALDDVVNIPFKK